MRVGENAAAINKSALFFVASNRTKSKGSSLMEMAQMKKKTAF